MSSTSNVYMNWLKLNMKIESNNDNFKQLLFCKTPQLHSTPVCSGSALFCNLISRHPRDVISCREREAALIFTQKLYLHFSRWSLVVENLDLTEPTSEITAQVAVHNTSHSETAIKVRGNGKTRWSKLVHIYIYSMLPQTPVFFMNATHLLPSSPLVFWAS